MSINRRDVGVVGAAAASLAASVAVTVVVLVTFAPVSPRQAVHDWLPFVPVPGLVVFAASRSGVFKTRPWLLLLVGPLAFLIGAVGVMTTHSLLFAPALLARKRKVSADAPAWSGDADDPLAVERWTTTPEPVMHDLVPVQPTA